jgi:hypothetical protein
MHASQPVQPSAWITAMIFGTTFLGLPANDLEAMSFLTFQVIGGSIMGERGGPFTLMFENTIQILGLSVNRGFRSSVS